MNKTVAMQWESRRHRRVY